MFIISEHYFEETIKYLLDNSIKPSTKKTYESAYKRYSSFCQDYNFNETPASKETLVAFVAMLFEQNLKGSTMKVYLSAIRHAHIKKDLADPLGATKLSLILKAVMALSGAPNRKLPITFDILCEICLKANHRYDALMIRAAMTLAYFACLRCGEMCIPDAESYDPNVHLSFSSIVFNLEEKFFTLIIKRSKTDKNNVGVKVNVGCSGHEICSYCIMSQYMQLMKCKPSSPLFLDPFGNILTKSHFVSTVRLLLSLCGKNGTLYSGHSFRAGSATDAGDHDFQSHEVKMLGRWASDAYNIYLRNPKRTSKFAKKLMKN